MVMFFVILIVAYLIGAIPTGYLIARLRGISDIREHGSGNIGATNVARTLGMHYFFLVFFLDFAKAYGLLMLLAQHEMEQENLLYAAIALLLGNAFPIFLKFKGGKGVATSLGIMAALNPWIIAYDAVIWWTVFGVTRTVGIASVAGLIGLPIISTFILHDACQLQIFFLFMAVWGIWLHRSNIINYLAKEKPR